MDEKKGKPEARFPHVSGLKRNFSTYLDAAARLYRPPHSYGKMFTAIVGFSIIWALLLALATRGGVMPSIFHRSIGDSSFVDTFMDFFNSIQNSANRRPYTEYQCIYPPLTYAFYFLLSMLYPDTAINQSGLYLRHTQTGFLLAAAYTCFTAAATGLLVYFTVKGKSPLKVLLTLSVCLSAPFLFQYERANIVIISLIFSMLFLWLKDSKNPVIRELAFISLAISAAIKLYPAVFGLLLVKNRRWKDCLRCVLWGLVFFLLPFAFFEGFTGLTTMLGNIMNTSGLHQAGGYGIKVNYANTFSMLLALIGLPSGMLIDIFQYASYFIGILLLISSFIHRTNWKVLSLLSLFMVSVPAFSFLYTLILMLIPLIAFLNSEEKPSRLDNIYFACFIGMFLIIPYSGTSPFEGNLGEGYTLHVGALLHSISVLLMSVLLIAEAVYILIKAHRSLAPAIKKYTAAALISACLLVASSVVFIGYKAYQKVHNGYIAPIDQLLDDHGLTQAETDLVFSRARWIRLFLGMEDSGAPDPSSWNLNRNYYSIQNYFANSERPFIVDKSTLFSLMEYAKSRKRKATSYWDELFGNYEVIDSTDRFILFVPKNGDVSGAWDVQLQTHEITGVRNGGAISEDGYLWGDMVVDIQILNLTGNTLPVEFQTEVYTKHSPSGNVEYELEGVMYKNVWLGLDNEHYDYWSGEDGHISILEELVLSPGLNMITLHAESGEAGLSGGQPVYMYLSEPVITPREDADLETFISTLESRGVDLSNMYGILKYPHLISHDGFGKIDESYFKGIPDYERVASNIGNWEKGIILDLYSIKVLTSYWNDLLWHAMEKYFLVARVGDYFYFEPAGADHIQPGNDFITDSYMNIIRSSDRKSMYVISKASYFSVINPYGRSVEAEISFTVKSFTVSDSRLFLDISGTRLNIPVLRGTEVVFRETVSLNPGVNRLQLIIDGDRTIDAPLPQLKYEVERPDFRRLILFPDGETDSSKDADDNKPEKERAYSLLSPDMIDSRDEACLREGITWGLLESAYFRIDGFCFRISE